MFLDSFSLKLIDVLSFVLVEENRYTRLTFTFILSRKSERICSDIKAAGTYHILLKKSPSPHIPCFVYYFTFSRSCMVYQIKMITQTTWARGNNFDTFSLLSTNSTVRYFSCTLRSTVARVALGLRIGQLHCPVCRLCCQGSGG